MMVRSEATHHLEDLWRYARVLTGNDTDADDVVQEALARAISSSHTYDPSRPMLQWLLRIVRNTFITGVTRMRAETTLAEEYAMVIDRSAQPTQEHEAEIAAVARAMRQLAVEQAEILHLVGVLGLTYAESAELLQVPIGTVMSRLSRARRSLRELLNGSASTRPALKLVGGTDEAP